MKFLLIATICSQIHLECLPPIEHSQHYRSHYDCATAGYLHAMSLMREMGQDFVNEEQIVIGFKCRPVSEI